MLTNIVYAGKIKVAATKNEPEQIVQGLHEAIITEDLYERVQCVANGKKMVKSKTKKVRDTFPMRGFLVCSSCGANLTASTSKGNGGHYNYYHCQPGCKERHKSDVVHSSFSSWLQSLSFQPEVAELYLAIMKDVFKTEEGDRDREIASLRKQLDDKSDMLTKSVDSLIKGDLDKWGYNVFKERTSAEMGKLKQRIQQLQETGSGFDTYLRYGISLMANLSQYYSDADLEGKQKFIGSIFPEKLVFDGKNYRTTAPNDLIDLLCSADKGSSGKGKEKPGENAGLFGMVAALGIEPRSRV